MTTNILSIAGQPTITVGIDMHDAYNLATEKVVEIHGTRIVTTSEIVGWFHAVTDYRSVETLKAAAELDANGYRKHADKLRMAVGQVEAMKRNDNPEWDVYLTELHGEAIDAATESAQ